MGLGSAFGNHSLHSMWWHPDLRDINRHLVHDTQNADLQAWDWLTLCLEVSVRNLILSLLSQWCRVKDSLKVSSSFIVFIKIYTPWAPARGAHKPCQLAGAVGRFPIQVTIPRILCMLSLSVGTDVSVMISALPGSACTLAVLLPLPGMLLLLPGVAVVVSFAAALGGWAASSTQIRRFSSL